MKKAFVGLQRLFVLNSCESLECLESWIRNGLFYWHFKDNVSRKPYIQMVCILGLTQWNLNSFEFKFDNTILSSQYKKKIGPLKKKFCCYLTCSVSALLAVSAKLRQPTGQRQSNIRMQKQKKIIGAHLILISLRNVRYQKIWIQNYLGFIVLILV